MVIDRFIKFLVS